MRPDSDLRVIVRQHARTAQLMGVDFVPAFRLSGSLSGSPPVEAASRADSSAGSNAPATTPAPPGGAGQRDPAEAQAQLDAIRARYEADAPHARFITSFNKIVFGEGDPCARLMFIGEAPGADEDRTGRPFVGRAGQLLDKMIVAMGLQRSQVYIANVLKTRPPDNATPTTEEAEACAPYLYDQIDAIRPEAIVTLGLPASRTILKSAESMGRLRGHWASFTHPRTGFAVPIMPTFHPAFLLRQYTDENRAKVWSDLQQVMVKLGLKAAAGR